MATARDTIGGMHLATGFLAYGIVKAMQDGAERAAALREVDRAHAVGQRYFARRLQQRKAAVRQDAHDAMAALMTERKRIHG